MLHSRTQLRLRKGPVGLRLLLRPLLQPLGLLLGHPARGVQQPPAAGFSPFTNRISGRSYDAAGNLLFEDGHSLQWDAESRLESMDNGATARYLYDYQGRRAVKLTPGQDRFYFHEASGEVLWEFVAGSPVQDLVRAFHNGRAFFENGSVGSHYLHADHLGSPRILSSTFGAVVDCRQFFTPFGQHAHECPGSDHRVDFTGKEEDGESRFTYFGARYHDPLMGRFLSTDPLLDSADPGDPQTWNRYLYTRNNPIRFVDPNGKDFFDLFTGSVKAIANVGIGIYNTAAALDNAVNDLVAFVPGVPPEPRSGYIEPFTPSNPDEDIAMFATDIGLILLGGRAGGGRAAGSAGGLTRGANFAQTTFSGRFSSEGSKFLSDLVGVSIKTVDDLAGAIKSGKVDPSVIPVNVIQRGGNTLILNTRTVQALERAGVPRSQFNVIDQTGNELFEGLLSNQLKRNRLSNAGTSSVKEN